jgi:signal peptidase II
MSAMIILLFSVPLLDQALKLVLQQAIGPGSVPLGPLGSLRIIRAKIWWSRSQCCPRLGTMWAIWFLAAAALFGVSLQMPSCDWCAGLLLGGSISHLLETSRHGFITDYVCLRFWPAFNLADVAITVGALGTGVGMLAKMKELFT